MVNKGFIPKCQKKFKKSSSAFYGIFFSCNIDLNEVKIYILCPLILNIKSLLLSLDLFMEEQENP